MGNGDKAVSQPARQDKFWDQVKWAEAHLRATGLIWDKSTIGEALVKETVRDPHFVDDLKAAINKNA